MHRKSQGAGFRDQILVKTNKSSVDPARDPWDYQSVHPAMIPGIVNNYTSIKTFSTWLFRDSLARIYLHFLISFTNI